MNRKISTVLFSLLMSTMVLVSCGKNERNQSSGSIQIEPDQRSLSESIASPMESVPTPSNESSTESNPFQSGQLSSSESFLSSENESSADSNPSSGSASLELIQPIFSEDVIRSIAKKYIWGDREWMGGGVSLYFIYATDETGCCYSITERSINGGYQPWADYITSFTAGIYWFDGENLKLYRYKCEGGELGEKIFQCDVVLDELEVVKRLEESDIEDEVRKKLCLQEGENLYVYPDAYNENCFYAIVSIDDETGIVGWGEDPVYWIDSNGDFYEADKLTPNPNRKVRLIGNIYK